MSVERRPPVEQLDAAFYRVTGYAEALAVLADPRACNDPFVEDVVHQVFSEEEAAAFGARRGVSMQLCDGAQHVRLRRIAAAALTSLRYRAPLGRMHDRARSLLDALVVRGEGDLIAEFVKPLVVDVICDVLGVPANDRDRVVAWSEASTMEDIAVSGAGVKSLDEYLESLLAAKGRQPDDDFCSTLAAARAAGDLTDAEMLGTASIMLVAGYETTVGFLSMSALTLLLAPLLRETLAEQPDWLPAAVEELLRYITPTKDTWLRFFTADMELGGTIIPAGSAVEVDLFSANHDPTRFDAPDLLDPSRDEDKHLAFGHGPHYCPGATLARKESHIILTALLPRLAQLTLGAPVPELRWHQNRFSRRPQTLPVVAAAAETGG